ncbi:hypothetical protein EDD11_008282 [Mortierella claussenii]|nr:hypothetical protein EDD11_008282 [Mortierella claussenii]
MAAGQQHVSAGQGRYYHDKKAFVNAQVRLLEAPIQPPPDWRRRRARLTAEGETYNSIPDATIAAALSKLHAASKKSLRLTFNNQSVRQLLEQLEANQHELRKKTRQGGIIIRTKSRQELLTSDWIEKFPETWQQRPEEQENSLSSFGGTHSPSSVASTLLTPVAATASSFEMQKYADVRSKIVVYQTKYQNLKDKCDYYKMLQTEIRRLDTKKIQNNILTPDSQIARELAKMEALGKRHRICTSIGT